MITTEAGTKLAIAPAGNPLAERSTVPMNPPVGVTVIVHDAVAPAVTVADEGVADTT